MNARTKIIYERLQSRDYRNQRTISDLDFATGYSSSRLPYPLRASQRFHDLVKLQEPIIFPEDRFGFTAASKRYRRF